jgi:PAS domain S-box-containing protein
MSEKASEASILDALSTGLIIVRSDETIEHWNEWLASASGKSATSVVGKPLKAAFPNVDIGAIDAAIAAAVASGASTILTNALHPTLLPLTTRTGGTLYHDVLVFPAGEPPNRHCVVQIVDVTSSFRRERFLRDRQNARYDALVESAPDAIVNVDSDAIIRLVNPAATKQFGYRAEELIGQQATVLFEAASAWDDIWQSISSGKASVRPVEVVVRLKDGRLRYFEVSAARWQDGIRTFTTAILRDVHERRDAEAALRESERSSRANARSLSELNEALKQSSNALNAMDRRKDEFLATLAHELRNPLAPLRNGLQLLKLAKDDSALVERTRQMMDGQLEQMVRLIDDLLDVSRINNDMIELNKELTSLDRVVRQAVETSAPLIDAQQHKLSIDIPAEEVLLDADVTRLTQVFANLLNNAAKYTPKSGHIAIKAAHTADSVTIRVTDDGIGIPKEMLSKIFDMFMQVDHSSDRSAGGLGIGLSLVKRLVAMHDGTVEAHSNGPRAGSEFVVRLPLANRPPASEPMAAKEDDVQAQPAPRRILVADDNEDSASSLALILRMLGHETKTANDGVQALEVAETFLPDVALLDIGMPKLDGYETARRMRQMPHGGKMLLIALTGWGQDEDRRRSVDAGFDAHIVKPVNVAEVQGLLARMLPNEAREMQRPAPSLH